MAEMSLVAVAAAAGGALGPVLHATATRYCRRYVAPWQSGAGSDPPLWLVTVTSAGGLAVLAARAHSVLPLVALSWLACGGLVLSCVDVAVRRLPDAVLGPVAGGLLGILAVQAAAGGRQVALCRAVLAGLVVAAGYGLLVLAGGMGFGDCKLAAVLGVACGWYGWVVVAAASVVAFVTAAAHLLVDARAGLTPDRRSVPFGPFLVLGAFTAILAFGGP